MIIKQLQDNLKTLEELMLKLKFINKEINYVLKV